MTCLNIGCIFFWICCAAVLVIDLLGWICFTKDGNRHMRHMFIDTYADLKHIEVETGNCINNDTRHCILKWRHWAYLEWLDTPRNQPWRDIDSPGFSPCVLKHTRKKAAWAGWCVFYFCFAPSILTKIFLNQINVQKKYGIAASSCLKASLAGLPLYILKGVFLHARNKEHHPQYIRNQTWYSIVVWRNLQIRKDCFVTMTWGLLYHSGGLLKYKCGITCTCQQWMVVSRWVHEGCDSAQQAYCIPILQDQAGTTGVLGGLKVLLVPALFGEKWNQNVYMELFLGGKHHRDVPSGFEWVWYYLYIYIEDVCMDGYIDSVER